MFTFAEILTEHGITIDLALRSPVCFQKPPTGAELDSLLGHVREFLKREDSSVDTSTGNPIQKAVAIICEVNVQRARLQRAQETRETAADHWSKFRFE
jgi:hypothetical protein